jgi:hypothetical protein
LVVVISTTIRSRPRRPLFWLGVNQYVFYTTIHRCKVSEWGMYYLTFGGGFFVFSLLNQKHFFLTKQKTNSFFDNEKSSFFSSNITKYFTLKTAGSDYFNCIFQVNLFFFYKIWDWIYWKKNVPQIKTVFWISVWKNPQTNNVVDYTPMIVPTNMFLIGPVVSKKKTKMWPPRSVIFLLICIWGPGPL